MNKFALLTIYLIIVIVYVLILEFVTGINLWYVAGILGFVGGYAISKYANSLAFAIIFLLPMIPCVAMWIFLSPVTFWQKFATFILDVVVYLAVFGFEIWIINS